MKWVLPLVACLCPCVAQAAASAADLARELREISLDPAACFRVRDLSLHKDEASVFLTDGYLIFAKPVAGAHLAAVFTADIEGGDAEVMLLPPNEGERRSLASYTGSPNLDEHITAAVLFFSDDTYAKLTAQIQQNSANRRTADVGALMAGRWTPVVRNVAATFQTRLVWDLLLCDPSHGFFAISMNSRRLGNFDLYYDRAAREQIEVGKLNARDGLVYFDIWSSFVARSFRNRTIPPELTLRNFRIRVNLQPDLSMSVLTRVEAECARTLPALAFDIAQPMKVTEALVDGKPAEVLQREQMRSQLLRNAGNETFLVVPPTPMSPNQKHELEFHDDGKVIADAGNDVYYVGARANWFPNAGLQFAKFDLTFRYPKDLDLVTPGELVDEHEDGNFRVTRRRTGVPIRFAGFNLGHYERVRISRGGYTVEVCANREFEPALVTKTPTLAPAPPPLRTRPEPEMIMLPPELPADPRARLKEIASEITSALEFFAQRFGPPALPELTVSPVPGRFGQGFPGLIYLSTMSYLAPQQRAIQALDATGRLFFSQILQAHETAHQWWGNVVTAAGYHDEWLMEALADYSALLYLENKEGSQPVALALDTYKTNLLEKTSGDKTVESTGPIVLGMRLENSQTPQAYHAITYGKGSWIMHMLRRRMGDQSFLAMLAQLRKEYERKPLSTEDFRLLAARFLPAHSRDSDLENFFDQWVYGTGIPALKMNYSVKGKGAALRLVGSVTQNDVDDGFSINVPIEVQMPRGKMMTEWVSTSSDPVSFSFPLRQAPVKVQLDPAYSILRK